MLPGLASLRVGELVDVVVGLADLHFYPGDAFMAAHAQVLGGGGGAGGLHLLASGM